MTIGSSTIDVNSLVSKLLDLEQTRRLNPLQNTKKGQEAQLSNYGSLQNLLKTFQDNVDKLKTAFNSVSYQVNSSESKNLTATITASPSMYAGSHTVVVDKLAQAQSVTSAGSFGTGGAGITGNLTITKGGKDFTITVAAGDTLAQIRDRLNASNNNNGITASILSTTGPGGVAEQRLVFTSNETGVANGFSLSGSAAGQFNMTNVVNEAQDAEFTFDGLSVVRPSNNISDVLEGLNFNLLKGGGATTTIDISAATQERNTNITTAVKNLVSSYNQAISFIDSNQATTGMRDNTLPLVKKQLQQAMDVVFAPSAPYRNLFEVGIKLSGFQDLTASTGEKYTSTGQYTVDETKLNAALANNFNGFKSIFMDSVDGMAARLSKTINTLTTAGGTLANRTDIIRQQKTFTDKEIETEQNRLDTLKTTLTAQYAQLNSILSKFEATNKMMEQQISALSNFYKK